MLLIKYARMLLMKESEQAGLMISVSSQKKWGISRSIQKDSHSNRRLWSRAFAMLMIRESRIRRLQRWRVMMTMYLSG